MAQPTFNIIGDGAIGHLWACYLQQNKHPAYLYSRTPKINRTIQVTSPNNNFVHKIQYHTLEQWQNQDAIIICVKAHQLEQLCKKLVKVSPVNCPIILMMNGLGLVEIMQHYFPEHAIFHAFVTHGAYLNKNHLVYTGCGQTLIGNLTTHYDEKLIKPIINCLNTVLPTACWNSNHLYSMTVKLIINSVINPITALKHIKNGEIIQTDELIQEAKELLNELAPLLPLLHSELNIKSLEQDIKNVVLTTKNNTSSMLQDILNKKDTEIEFINGYLTKQAENNDLILNKHLRVIKKIKGVKFKS